MGTGKTEVGRRLARALGRTFVDTDRLVEAKAGRSVAVIATGGGALVHPENRRRLAEAGPIVCLTASPQEILRRVGRGETRPLLAGATSDAERLARIRKLLDERATAYGSATHTIDTTG